MSKLTTKTGFAAIVLGVMLLLELVITSLAFTADDDFVYLLGHRINIVCATRQRLGIPCPTCGFTRGFVLTVHGRVRQAWRLSPTGPLAAVGIFGMGLALLSCATVARRRSPGEVAAMKRWVQAGALTYAGAGTLIWVSTWISVIARLR